MWVVLHITMEGLKDETWAFWLKLTLSLPRRGGEGGGGIFVYLIGLIACKLT